MVAAAKKSNFCCIFQSKPRVNKEQSLPPSYEKQAKQVFPNPKDEKVN